MPFSLSSLFPGHPNRIAPLPPPSNPRTCRCNHTHDRHTSPIDQLHISLSDPVLVAAEKRLSSVPRKKQFKQSMIKDADTITPGHLVLHLDGGNLFQTSGVCDDGFFAADTGGPPKPTDAQRTSARYSGKTGVRGAMDKLLESLDDHCDISEVMTIASTADNSRNGSDLAPLASEMFKEELYTRGYLKRPTSRPSNVGWKTRTGFMLASCKAFPKVLLGRRQGRKAAANCLKEEQDADKTAGDLDSEKLTTSVASVTLRVPYTESPGTDTTTSASESFDLHEFSYITAFTTPPSSPSIVLDARTLKKGVSLDDGKHAV